MVGAVWEMASMKRRKLWKTGEDGLCCSSSAIQTRLGPSSLLEERSEIPIVFVVLLCCRLPYKLGETAKVYRYRRFPFGFFIVMPLFGQSTFVYKFCLRRGTRFITSVTLPSDFPQNTTSFVPPGNSMSLWLAPCPRDRGPSAP